MKLVSITLEGFIGFSDKHTVVFRDGIVAVTGHNGAGKTSIVDAITWALMNKTRIENKDGIINHECDEAVVALRYQVGSELFEVEARKSRKKSRSVQTYSIDDSDNRTAVSDHTNASSQEVIDSHFGNVDWSIILSAFLMRQDYGSEIISGRPVDTRRTLTRLLQLVDFEEIEEKAAERIKANQLEAETLESTSSQLVELLEKIKKRPKSKSSKKELKAKLKALEGELSDIDEVSKQAEKLKDSIESLEASIASAEEKTKLENLLDKTTKKEKKLVEKIQEGARQIKAFQEDYEQALKKETKVFQSLKAEEKALKKLKHLDSEAECPTCKQMVDKKHLKGVKKTHKSKIEELMEKAPKVTSDQLQEEMEAISEENQEHLDKRSSLKSKIAVITNQISELRVPEESVEHSEDDLAKKESELKALTSTQKTFRSVSDVSDEIKEVEIELAVIKANSQSDENSKEEMQEKVKENKREIKRLQASEEALKTIRSLASPSGIPADIVSLFLLEVDEYANAIYENLGKPFRQRFVVREEASDGTYKDVFYLRIDRNGHSIRYPALSGGERSLVQIANFAALAQALKNRYGYKIEWMILDEPFINIDNDSIPILMAALRSIQDVCALDTILIVTHEPEFVEACDRELLVSNNGLTSTTEWKE